MEAQIVEKVLPRMREIAALLLWDIEAVKVNLDEPFKLVSGNYSPIYINCRLAISHPTLMQFFVASAQIICEHHHIRVDVVAGGETAGIPFAAYLAQGLSAPMVYVRKSKKGHGIDSLVEGHISQNNKVLLVEDLITDGGSKLHFVDAIRAAGGIVENVFVLFDREQGGKKTLKEHGIQLYSATDMTTVLKVSEESGILSKESLEFLFDYLNNPLEWQNKHN